MKHVIPILLLLLPLSISAQRKIFLGMTTGFGQTLPDETSHFAYSQTRSFCTEGLIQIKSGLYWVIGSGYQLRVHVVKPEFDNELVAPRKTMGFMTWYAGLQWKQKWWYTGVGAFLLDMLGTNTEAYPAIFTDFPPIPTPRYFLYSQNYSSSGYFGQLGITPPIGRGLNAMAECNWHFDYLDVFGNYPGHLSLPGVKIGLQYRFN